MASRTRRDYSKIKNFPQGATIQKHGKHLYVITRQYVYDRTIGRGRDVGRKIIGQVVDDVYYTNEEYRRKFQRGIKPRRIPLLPGEPMDQLPAALIGLPTQVLQQFLKAEITEINVGPLPIFHCLLKRIGITEDLKEAFGPDMANIILSLSFYFAIRGSNSACQFPRWTVARYLPDFEPLTDRDISTIYDKIGQHQQLIQKFIGLRIARNMQEPMLLSVDSTTIPWECSDSEKNKWGMGKRHHFEKQLGLMVTFNLATHQPILYRTLPGNLHDSQTVLDLLIRLREYGIEQQAIAVMDRGYMTEENLKMAVEQNCRCIFAVPFGRKWLDECAPKALSEFTDAKSRVLNPSTVLKDGAVQGTTVIKRLKIQGRSTKVYVHIYKSMRNAAWEKQAFFNDLQAFEDLWNSQNGRAKRLQNDSRIQYFEILDEVVDGQKRSVLKRDSQAIKEQLKSMGLFAAVSSWKCTAQECFDFYGYRCDIERVFRSGKNNAGLGVMRTHNDRTAHGKIFVEFITLALLEEIKRQLASEQRKTLKTGRSVVEIPQNTFDYEQVLGILSGLSYTKRKSTGELFIREVTAKQKEVATACGCKGIFDSIYTY